MPPRGSPTSAATFPVHYATDNTDPVIVIHNATRSTTTAGVSDAAAEAFAGGRVEMQHTTTTSTASIGAHAADDALERSIAAVAAAAGGAGGGGEDTVRRARAPA
jgi:hypothetical protein